MSVRVLGDGDDVTQRVPGLKVKYDVELMGTVSELLSIKFEN